MPHCSSESSGEIMIIRQTNQIMNWMTHISLLMQVVYKSWYVFVCICSSQHSLVNGDTRVDESGFVSGTSTPQLPAAAAAQGCIPTAPSRSSLSSNSSTA